MDSQELFDDYLEGTIYEGKQVAPQGIHLTAGTILAPRGAGDTDFGGDEHSPCDFQVVKPEKRNPDDDYGWWELDGGHYRVVFNESLRDCPVPLLLTANARILDCGCHLASCVPEQGELATTLTVPDCGGGIKENARIGFLSRRS